MPSILYPKHHVNEVCNVPDHLFHPCLGLMLGGKVTARRLGCCKEILYRDADDLNLTVVRRNHLHLGRYFLVSEIDALIKQRQKYADRFGRRMVQKISRGQ